MGTLQAFYCHSASTSLFRLVFNLAMMYRRIGLYFKSCSSTTIPVPLYRFSEDATMLTGELLPIVNPALQEAVVMLM